MNDRMSAHNEEIANQDHNYMIDIEEGLSSDKIITLIKYICVYTEIINKILCLHAQEIPKEDLPKRKPVIL